MMALQSPCPTLCPEEEEPLQKLGSCCAGSEQCDPGIQASCSCVSGGASPTSIAPSALPQLQTPSASFSPCRPRGPEPSLWGQPAPLPTSPLAVGIPFS